jgi:hypothetical protein
VTRDELTTYDNYRENRDISEDLPMGNACAATILAGLLCTWAPTTFPDLSKVERTIVREPAYQTAPRYCLIVFGPKADCRVWLVRDGDTLYVDRNANGDLTEPGESLGPTTRREFMTVDGEKHVPYRTMTYALGDLTPTGSHDRHTGLELTQYQIGDKPAEVVMSLVVNGITKQYAGWTPLFRESRELASIVHFGGPMVAQPVRYRSISLSAANPELHLRFGTPGLEKSTFASLGYEAVPEYVHPRAEIEWPRVGQDSTVVRTTVILSGRC